MSNKSASGSGPGGYQTPASARPLTTVGAAARVGATPVTTKPAATTPVTAPATPAAAKSKLSIADRLQQIRDMRARSQSAYCCTGWYTRNSCGKPNTKSCSPKHYWCNYNTYSKTCIKQLTGPRLQASSWNEKQ